MGNNNQLLQRMLHYGLFVALMFLRLASFFKSIYSASFRVHATGVSGAQISLQQCLMPRVTRLSASEGTSYYCQVKTSLLFKVVLYSGQYGSFKKVRRLIAAL